MRVGEVELRERREGSERSEAVLVVAGEEPGRVVERDELELPVPVEVEELLAESSRARRRSGAGDRWDGRNGLCGPETAAAEVALVEPAAALLAEEARQALPVEIEEAVARPV